MLCAQTLVPERAVISEGRLTDMPHLLLSNHFTES